MVIDRFKPIRIPVKLVLPTQDPKKTELSVKLTTVIRQLNTSTLEEHALLAQMALFLILRKTAVLKLA